MKPSLQASPQPFPASHLFVLVTWASHSSIASSGVKEVLTGSERRPDRGLYAGSADHSWSKQGGAGETCLLCGLRSLSHPPWCPLPSLPTSPCPFNLSKAGWPALPLWPLIRPDEASRISCLVTLRILQEWREHPPLCTHRHSSASFCFSETYK